MDKSPRERANALEDFNTAKVPCVDEDGNALEPQPLARDFLKFETNRIIEAALRAPEKDTPNYLDFVASEPTDEEKRAALDAFKYIKQQVGRTIEGSRMHESFQILESALTQTKESK